MKLWIIIDERSSGPSSPPDCDIAYIATSIEEAEEYSKKNGLYMIVEVETNKDISGSWLFSY